MERVLCGAEMGRGIARCLRIVICKPGLVGPRPLEPRRPPTRSPKTPPHFHAARLVYIFPLSAPISDCPSLHSIVFCGDPWLKHFPAIIELEFAECIGRGFEEIAGT